MKEWVYYFGVFYLSGVLVNVGFVLYAIFKSLIYSFRFEEHKFVIPDKSTHKTILMQIVLGWNYWLLELMDVIWF